MASHRRLLRRCIFDSRPVEDQAERGSPANTHDWSGAARPFAEEKWDALAAAREGQLFSEIDIHLGSQVKNRGISCCQVTHVLGNDLVKSIIRGVVILEVVI